MSTTAPEIIRAPVPVSRYQMELLSDEARGTALQLYGGTAWSHACEELTGDGNQAVAQCL